MYSALGLFVSYFCLTGIGISSTMLKNKIIYTINASIKMKYIHSALDSKTTTQDIDEHLSYLTGDLKLLEENGLKMN